MNYKSLFLFLLVFAIPACAHVDTTQPVMPSQTAAPDSSKDLDLHTPFPTQVMKSEPTTIEPADDETSETGANEQMPVFLEVIQTIIMGDNTRQGPSLGVGPNVYIYNPDNKVLSLNQTVVVETDTNLLIGVVAILQTPNQEYTKKEIIQYPSRQPVLIQIAAFNTETDTVTILHEDQEVDLSVGESHTFKQVGDDSKTSTLITQISNYGKLTNIQPVSPDGSWR